MANATISNSTGEKWYFTKEQLENTPSRKCGFDAHKELSYRQQAANFIQDMGQRLKVSQLCINTAIVYMHRFYVFHSFTHFPWYQMAAAALFLAAKVEEQPRKLEYVIKVANICRNSRDTNIDVTSERYIAQSQDLVFNENVLLQTLGFDVAIDHPHTHVVRCCHLVRASKDLAQTSYFMASNSLHLTTMCIQYKPTVVACFCILVACKWSNWEIPLSNEKKPWYSYVDQTVTAELLKQLTEEFLVIFEACPSRLKEKILAIPDNVAHAAQASNHMGNHSSVNFDTPDTKKTEKDGKEHKLQTGSEVDPHKHRMPRPLPHDTAGSGSSVQREKTHYHRERLDAAAQMKSAMGKPKMPPPPPGSGTHQQRPPADPKLKQPHSRPPSMGSHQPRDVQPQPVREKDAQKQRSGSSSGNSDYLLKPNVQTDYHTDKQRMRLESSASTSSRNRYDVKASLYVKPETDNVKKHMTGNSSSNVAAPAAAHSYLNKPFVSTSQQLQAQPKMKSSPVETIDAPKSVPRQQQYQQPNLAPARIKQDMESCSSGNNNGSLFAPGNVKQDLNVKDELTKQLVKEEVPVSVSVPVQPVIKRPSLFSPEKTPPRAKKDKSSPLITGKKPGEIQPLSPLISPPQAGKRNRNCSSGSEPELRPVMTKIDQVEGFENLIRDSTIGMNKINQQQTQTTEHRVKGGEEDVRQTQPSHSQPVVVSEPTMPWTSSGVVNGMGTDPLMISSLLREAAAATTTTTDQEAKVLTTTISTVEKDHHHHKSKKKKEKHKHKDKDKNKEEKEKKKKHKDKDREKYKHKEKHQQQQQYVGEATTSAEPIKLKIHKDKVQVVADNPTTTAGGGGAVMAAPSSVSSGLKIKIPRDKIRTEGLPELMSMPLQPPPSIKLKIPKEVIYYNNCNADLDNGMMATSSRKRERDRSPNDTPSKIPRINYGNSDSGSSGSGIHKDAKQNGRHSSYQGGSGSSSGSGNNSKVQAQIGDGDASVHRLAESKYTHNSTSS